MRTSLVAAMLSFALAPCLQAALLLPFDHPGCETALDEKMTCDSDMQFYRASDGRCGCLASHEFYALEICIAATITCDEFDQAFASLYQYRLLDGALKKKAVGCGCFATYDAFPRE